ncbi:MAG: hypothetical protein ACC641_01835, partial [Acidiferrobacterales bacterium]
REALRQSAARPHFRLARLFHKHIQFCEESHHPGFYYRMDKNFVDEDNWKYFVNSIYDKKSKTYTCFKRAHKDLVDKTKLFK